MLSGADNDNIIEIVNWCDDSSCEFDSSENFVDFKYVATW